MIAFLSRNLFSAISPGISLALFRLTIAQSGGCRTGFRLHRNLKSLGDGRIVFGRWRSYRLVASWKLALLLRWQRLLPIDNELPRPSGVTLPNLKLMTGLGAPVAIERILSVGIREIGRVAHVTPHRFEGHLAARRI